MERRPPLSPYIVCQTYTDSFIEAVTAKSLRSISPDSLFEIKHCIEFTCSEQICTWSAKLLMMLEASSSQGKLLQSSYFKCSVLEPTESSTRSKIIRFYMCCMLQKSMENDASREVLVL